MKTSLRHITLAAAMIASPAVCVAQEGPSRTLFSNVNVFDGTSDALIENGNVLVEGNMIAAVSADPIAADGATVIDGDPTQDIRLLMDPDNIDLIMKDGVIYKDTL